MAKKRYEIRVSDIPPEVYKEIKRLALINKRSLRQQILFTVEQKLNEKENEPN